MDNKIFDCIILGGGPAGLSAALYAARGNIKTAIIDITSAGGQPVNYLEIENYLGFPKINGFELAEKFEEHVDKFNVEKFINEEIQSINLTDDVKTITTLKGKYCAKSIIIATGAHSALLGIKGEKEYKGRGVSYCAVCDGAFYKEKVVVVIGGGNSALEEAQYLTKFAKKVYVMHRRDEFRADRIVQARAFGNEKIEFIFNSIPTEIIGENNKVVKIQYKNVQNGNIETLDVDGVFPYIGFSPNTDFINGQVMQDEKGFIITDETMQTNIRGVFAAGDVRKTPLRQVITAVSDGAIAGAFVVKYIEELTLKEKSIRI